MKIISHYDLDELSRAAQLNPRIRQHMNMHKSYSDPCQRLFNAIEPESYIRPHLNNPDQGEETILAIRGLMAVICFGNKGEIKEIKKFGSELLSFKRGISAGAIIPPGEWHTVVSLMKGSILLEVKSGPFNESKAKIYAPWAPEEGSVSASTYLSMVKGEVSLC